MALKKAQRLIKIARELNIGIETIVEFLHKQGKEIDSNPNAKIDPESVDLLVKVYKPDLLAKEESKKVVISRHKEKKSTVSIDDVNKIESTKDNEVDDNQNEIVIVKDSSIGKTNYPEQKEKSKSGAKHKSDTDLDNEISHVNKDKDIKLNVVGKIDLSEKKKKDQDQRKEKNKKAEPELAQKASSHSVKKKKEENDKKEIQDVKSIKKEEIPEKQQEVSEETKTIEPVKEEKISEDKSDNIEPENKKEEKQDKMESTIVSEKVVETDIQIENNEKKSDDSTQEEFVPVSEQVKFESDIKVVGKIDLSSLNQKTRPDKKTKEQKIQERKEKELKRKKEQNKRKRKLHDEGQSSHDNTNGNGSDSENSDEVYKTKVKKLSGPTVIGKIKISDEEKKKQDSNQDHSKSKKKKRKRIQKEPVSVKDKLDHNKNKKDKGDDRKSRSRRKDTRRDRRNIQRKEVNEEDVQKQIKETLARLTAGKQKSKGAKHRRQKRDLISKKIQQEAEELEMQKNIIQVTEFVSVNELASMMNVQATDVISTCMSLGLFVAINQRLDAETISIVAEEFGYQVEFISVDVQEQIQEEEDTPEDLEPRPPIVTVMGHVDHGKTSLLDYVRSANVIAGEAGGITQHIGAYKVKISNNKQITFLDTPGHQAFTAMRARGASVTDVAIIVVAADDNVMPQTIEAINHAKAANVPIVFAINKIDKPGANPDKIKEELANMNLLIEEWGGKFQSQDISAKHGTNIEELLEKVLLEAEMLELKANPAKRASGSIIESTLDKGRGYVATMLVQNGTLKVGDVVLAGCHFGKVKAMYNERNQRVYEAGPSEPVLILGLDGAPQAGDNFNVLVNEREAREIANKREQLQREQEHRAKKHITLDEIGRRIAIGNFQELNIIIKGDVDGSVEALADSLIKLSTEQIQVNVIHKAVGQISESDIDLATASNAIVIGFQVRPSTGARKMAESEGIDIRLYSIIYDAINELKDAMEGMLSPEVKEEVVGTADVREVFKISKVGTVAGCMVVDGKILKNAKLRVIRDGIVVYTGELSALKRFKEDVKEVKHGYECGISVERFNDIKVGDSIEAFEEKMVKQKIS